jgi:hypothetical protein
MFPVCFVGKLLNNNSTNENKNVNVIVKVKEDKDEAVQAGHSDFCWMPACQVSPFNVCENPRGDGNCQFAALCSQLKRVLDVDISTEDLRRRIVSHLTQNPCTPDLSMSRFDEFCADKYYGKWDLYLSHMRQSGTYGDNFTLLAAAIIFQVQIVVISTLGPNATIVISKTGEFSTETKTLYVGHYDDKNYKDSCHYISLAPVDNFDVTAFLLNCKSQTADCATAIAIGNLLLPAENLSSECESMVSGHRSATAIDADASVSLVDHLQTDFNSFEPAIDVLPPSFSSHTCAGMSNCCDRTNQLLPDDVLSLSSTASSLDVTLTHDDLKLLDGPFQPTEASLFPVYEFCGKKTILPASVVSTFSLVALCVS